MYGTLCCALGHAMFLAGVVPTLTAGPDTWLEIRLLMKVAYRGSRLILDPPRAANPP
jgi:hypothetical protein